MDLLELICEGNMGLLRAAEKYDGTKGVRFISYAVWWIRQAMREALLHTRTVRLPISRVDTLMQIRRASESLAQKYGRSATSEEVVDETGMQEDQIEETLLMGQNVASLDTPSWGDGEGCLLDIVEDPHQSPEEEVTGQMLAEDLEAVLSLLGGRQADVLRHYFGLGGRRRLTLEEIAGRYGLTRERIRQIKDQALRRLERRARRCRLESYLEG